MDSHCMICKHPLKDFTSVKIGMGPVCRGRLSMQQELFEDIHAVYEVLRETNTFIFIKDIGHKTHKSITNDVEFVLESLAADYNIKYRRIFYIDSMNEIDEIIHSEKHFISFKHGHEGVEL
ncbi:hypothetical protein FACS189447_07710 [Spirochaetia bacterium]|nr:hypothetical protein FACS189447_07710 [Spirochaetia bacterium]